MPEENKSEAVKEAVSQQHSSSIGSNGRWNGSRGVNLTCDGAGRFFFLSFPTLKAPYCAFAHLSPSPPILEQTEAPPTLPLPNFPTRRRPFRIVSPPPLSPYLFLGRRERVGERRPPILRRKATRLSPGSSGKESIGGHTCIKNLYCESLQLCTTSILQLPSTAPSPPRWHANTLFPHSLFPFAVPHNSFPSIAAFLISQGRPGRRGIA